MVLGVLQKICCLNTSEDGGGMKVYMLRDQHITLSEPPRLVEILSAEKKPNGLEVPICRQMARVMEFVENKMSIGL